MNKFIVITFLSIIITSCHSNANIKSISNSNLNLTSPAYFEKWIAGVEGGGSGFNVFLPIKKPSFINFDSIHFRGQCVKALHRNNMVFGRFKSINNNHSEDIIIENTDHEKNNSHFSLLDNSCVLSYRIQNKRMYYEFKNLDYKPSKPYPVTRIR
jgi:hypothetical protein